MDKSAARVTVDFDYLALPCFMASPRRFAFQLWQGFIAQTQHPSTRPSMVARIAGRAALSRGAGIEVQAECDCGSCRIVSTFGGPRYTTVCHCSICRG